MAFTQTTDHPNKLIITAFSAFVDGNEVQKALQSIFTTPPDQSSFNHLWDCRYIGELDVSWDDMKRFRATATHYSNSEVFPRGKLVVIVNRELIYASARAILQYSCRGCKKNKVSWNPVEALNWLGLKEEAVSL